MRFMKRLFFFNLCMALLVAGCASPDRVGRAQVYDFGPGVLDAKDSPAGQPAIAPAVALADMDAAAALDTTAVLYRLAYADPQQPRAYAQARWSMPPAQLLRQRLRDRLGRSRAVLNAGEVPPVGGRLLLRVELEEFSQVFDSPELSSGLVRLRATALQGSARGDQLLGQRSVTVRRPAPTADAGGGVRALTSATDAAIEEVEQWLATLTRVP